MRSAGSPSRCSSWPLPGASPWDLYVRARTLPPLPQLEAPPLSGDAAALARAWEFRLLKRALAFAVFRYRTTTGSARVEAEVEAQRLMDDLGYPPEPVESMGAGAPLRPATAARDGGTA